MTVTGMVVGLGTGSTSAHFVRQLGERVRQGLRVKGVPTSEATRNLAEQVGVPLLEISQVSSIDVDVDGADEVDPQLAFQFPTALVAATPASDTLIDAPPAPPASDPLASLVVTPSMTPIDCASLISPMSPESMKIFIVAVLRATA